MRLIKWLIIGFAVLFIVVIALGILRSCGSAFRSTPKPTAPAPQVQALPLQQLPAQAPGQPPAAPQGQPTTPAGQSAAPGVPVAAIPEFRPVIVDTDPSPEVVRGKAILDVYNIECNNSDLIPQGIAPIFSAIFSETTVASLKYNAMAPRTIFNECTLGRLHWLFFSAEDGTYAFGLQAHALRGGLRINGSPAVPFQEGAVSSQIKLHKGWYEMEFRVYKGQAWGAQQSYTLLMKKPSDMQMNLIEATELFARKEEVEKFKETEPTPAKGKGEKGKVKK